MSKKSIVFTVIVVCVLAVVGVFGLVHNDITDRFNPTISMTTSYAKVPKGSSKYTNVAIIDKNGKALSYKLKYFNGYDPDGQYVKIVHKGQYVKNILYIKKSAYDAIKNK
ncbi:MAG: YxeA family protein [Lactobacillus sp.]|nr:YxeA family protein [Lactobacillus sp.]